MGFKTTREKVMIIFLVVMVVLAAWYMLFLTPSNDRVIEMLGDGDEDIGYIGDLKNYNQTLVDQINVYKKWQEQFGIDINDESDDFTKIADYNNIIGLTNTLNTILQNTTEFSLSFNPPEIVTDKKAYRRNISASFTTENYATAYEIIKSFNSLDTGCLIGDMSINTTEDKTQARLAISVFEYYDSRATTEAAAEQSAQGE